MSEREHLPYGPTEDHIGRTVTRRTLDGVKEGRVQEVDPFGGWVRIDGRFYRGDMGRWELQP